MEQPTVLAPAGWGFRPGAVLAGGRKLGPRDLPDLPLLRVLRPSSRKTAILDALQAVPGLADAVRASDLVAKYGITKTVAWELLRRCR